MTSSSNINNLSTNNSIQSQTPEELAAAASVNAQAASSVSTPDDATTDNTAVDTSSGKDRSGFSRMARVGGGAGSSASDIQQQILDEEILEQEINAQLLVQQNLKKEQNDQVNQEQVKTQIQIRVD